MGQEEPEDKQLTEEQIIQGNITIALFDGYKIENELLVATDGIRVAPKNLTYHDDWNALMDVIELIEELPIPGMASAKISIDCPSFAWTQKDQQPLLIYPALVMVEGQQQPDYEFFDTRILGVWVSVVSFLKWFNALSAQKPKPQTPATKKKFDILGFAKEFADSNDEVKRIELLYELDDIIVKTKGTTVEPSVVALREWTKNNITRGTVLCPPTMEEIQKYFKVAK